MSKKASISASANALPEKPEFDNRLFYGDNIDVLRKYIPSKSVDLCYIDPPFNSKRKYNQIYKNIGSEDQAQAQAFIDTWTWDVAADIGIDEIMSNKGGVFTDQSIELIIGLEKVLKRGSLMSYIVSMTLRIAEIYRVLKDTGSFYLHCDPTASHYLKLVVDSIFCAQNGEYHNEIIWRRTGAHNKIVRYAPIHDVIFFYTKTDKYTWNFPKKAFMKGHIEENFIKDEKGYRTNYYGNVLTGSGIRNGESGMVWRGFDPTAKGRHWAIPSILFDDYEEDISQLSQHQKLDLLYELGFVKINEGDAWPIYERYLTKNDGQALPDIWSFQPYTNGTVFQSSEGIDESVRWLSTKDSERLGYPTQKPEGILERIIKASTKEGDLVLDAYCGCGTTVAVAQKFNRKWIGIDVTYQSISLILKRLEDAYDKNVINNIEINGVPKDLNSAIALATKKDDKTRKEFEKWMVLTYSNNRATINDKKGGDGGIDGTAHLIDLDSKNKQEYRKAIFSVKSNKTLPPSVVRDLNGVLEREGAVVGFLLTLYPMPNLVKESKKYGTYHNKAFSHDYPKISVISVEELLHGERLNLPMSVEVLKKAKKKEADNQTMLNL